MIPVLFALVAGFGAWMALRGNPLYSTRSSLLLVAFMILGIAALVGVIVAAVKLTFNRSPTVAAITIGTIVVVGTLALIFIIPRMTTPKEAILATALPPSAKVVHIHRQKVYKWTKLLAIMLVVCGILAMVLPGEASMIGWVPGSIALILAVFGLLPMYFKARTLDISLTALMCNPWFHWQYPPEEWKQWAEVQGERTAAKLPKISRQREVFVGVISSATVAVLSFIFYPGSSLRARTLYALGLGGGTYAFCLWKARYDKGASGRLRTTLLKAAPQAYIGREGLFSDGDFTTWFSSSIYLTSASIDERPPRSLIFRFTKFVGRNPYSLNFSSGYATVDRRVLIPPGAESDVVRLQQELSARCPKAQIALA